MSDYQVDLPLWDEAGLLDPQAVDLPPPLREALLAWQRLFEAEFDYDHGWRSTAARQAYCRAAPGLRRWLERELEVAIDLDLWPCDG